MSPAREVSPFGATWRGLAPIGTGEACLQAGMDSPNSWSTNNQAHVSASNHSNPIGTTQVPPPTRIRTRGSEYESHESPEDGHARLSNSAQDEVRDMRHAIAPHFYEDKSIMSHCNDGSHSNLTTTLPCSGRGREPSSLSSERKIRLRLFFAKDGGTPWP